jgi:hypothetical protein
MAIENHNKTAARSREKMNKILRFLKEETYTDLANLMLLFESEFKTPPPLYRVLEKLIRLGLIEKHIIGSRCGNISLWGITMDGLAVVCKPEDPVFPPNFVPSSVTGFVLEHHLDTQQARVLLEKKGATNWIKGDRKNFLHQFRVKHRPDGVITLPNGKRIAIEMERNLKTPRRYQAIMAGHLLAWSEGVWSGIFYIVPHRQKKIALMKIFETTKCVIVNNSPVTLEQHHRDTFKFFTLDELKAHNLHLKSLQPAPV